MPSSKNKAVCIIIAIENYHNHDIPSVDFATNDAQLIKELMISNFDVQEQNISFWLDKDANKSTLENDLPYFIRGLDPDSKFYFYYAGHGFYKDGSNRLSVWDTHPFNLEGTTVSLDEILLKPLQNSSCSRSLIFIDACASYIQQAVDSRDILASLNNREFEDFIKKYPHRGMFFSCSPGEKSYPSTELQHGIWTWHLANALQGKAKEAIVNQLSVTDSSLRDYLVQSVPQFIRKKTELRGKQTPYAIISSSSTFEIVTLRQQEIKGFEAFPKVRLDVEKAYLRRLESRSIRSLDGFDRNRGHFIPKSPSSQASDFVQKLLDPVIKEETQEIYNRAKEILKLKRKDIEHRVEVGGAAIDTEFFRFTIDTQQDPDEPAKALIVRRIYIRVGRAQLPENFNRIFPSQPNEIVIPLSGNLDYEHLVDQFENLKEKQGGDLEDNQDESKIEYETDLAHITILVQDEEMIIYPKQQTNCLNLIEGAEKALDQIAGKRNRKLLK